MIRTSVRLRRAMVALTLTAAAASTALGVAGPASARTSSTCTPVASITVNSKTTTQVVRYGDYVDVTAQVAANCTGGSYNPTTPLYGTLQIQRSYDNVHWSTVSTGSTAGYAYISGTNVAPKVAGFRAVYTGGTDPTYGDTYSSSTSSTIVVGVYRKTSYSWKSVRRAVRYNWKISPTASISGLNAVFFKKTATGWKRLKAIRVSSTGHVVATFGVGTYKMQLPTARGLIASYVKFRVTRY